MENYNSFERMASGISNDERQTILSRLQNSGGVHGEENILPVETITDDDNESFETQIKKEPFLLKLMLWLKSVLTNTNKELLYNEHKLHIISKNIERNYPGLIDAKRGLMLAPFYQKLEELKACAAFFRPYLSAASEDEGGFFVSLASLVMPDITGEMNANVDPYANSDSLDAKPELRLQLLHKMDDIFENIPSIDRQKMYDAVKSIEWLKQFERLPFSRFLALFSSIGENVHTAPLSALDNEIDQFSKTLCNGFRITDELLESLYIFSVRKMQVFSSTDNEAETFMSKARSHTSLINMFMSSIPMKSLGKIIHSDSQWTPMQFAGGEDWFVKYKSAWKKIFEQKWEAFVKDCHKETLKVTLKSSFDLMEFPLLPERPWAHIWGGIPFRYELTAGFMYWFMHNCFPTHELTLKTILMEGAFANKDNQVNFTDDFNNFIQFSISFQGMNRKLSSGGEIGMLFSKLKEDHLRTLQAQTKVEHTVRGVESDIGSLIHKFGDSCRSTSMILGGIVGTLSDTRYGGLTNLNRLAARDNHTFIQKVQEAKTHIETAVYLLTELESIDTHKK